MSKRNLILLSGILLVSTTRMCADFGDSFAGSIFGSAIGSTVGSMVGSSIAHPRERVVVEERYVPATQIVEVERPVKVIKRVKRVPQRSYREKVKRDLERLLEHKSEIENQLQEIEQKKDQLEDELAENQKSIDATQKILAELKKADS